MSLRRSGSRGRRPTPHPHGLPNGTVARASHPPAWTRPTGRPPGLCAGLMIRTVLGIPFADLPLQTSSHTPLRPIIVGRVSVHADMGRRKGSAAPQTPDPRQRSRGPPGAVPPLCSCPEARRHLTSGPARITTTETRARTTRVTHPPLHTRRAPAVHHTRACRSVGAHPRAASEQRGVLTPPPTPVRTRSTNNAGDRRCVSTARRGPASDPHGVRDPQPHGRRSTAAATPGVPASRCPQPPERPEEQRCRCTGPAINGMRPGVPDTSRQVRRFRRRCPVGCTPRGVRSPGARVRRRPR